MSPSVCTPSGVCRGRIAALSFALAVAVSLAGCSSTAPSGAPGHGESSGLSSAHVHGVAVNPADGLVYLATHDGLFRYGTGRPTRVGPVIDLMGFTVVGPDQFYASGHPGPGVDLPQPVGLIASTDGGRTWSVRSRQGESDFHALAASGTAVVGFDGALRSSPDGRSWRQLAIPAAPHSLAASPDGRILLATAESGVLRSADAGANWTAVHGAPLLVLVDWAEGDTVVGVTPDGSVAVSDDAGRTWEQRGRVGATPQAIGAHGGHGGKARVLVVTETDVLDSTDAGATFAPLRTG